MAKLEILQTAIMGVRVLVQRAIGDSRGYFIETYNQNDFLSAGISDLFVQDNQSYSKQRGTVRGLHFQRPPYAQAKLVRVLQGAVLDVAVDIRAGSPTHGKYVAELLTAENQHELLIPKGFAHGFCTLEPDTIVFYKVSTFYAPETEHGIRWDDADLAINWGIERDQVVLSERDQQHPLLRDLPAYFRFDVREVEA